MEKKIILEDMYDELVGNIKSYHPMSDDLGMIREAFEVACKVHTGQTRKSGEPFVIHPIAVAIILSELRLDKESIIAALLHDVVEDTEMTKNDVCDKFGEEVTFLVDGVTKLSHMSSKLSRTEMKSESFRKLILATAEDIRVIIIKLADRLHNMRTLQFQSKEKQIEISDETMDIYSPIAQRLGISNLSIQLEDLSFLYLFPKEYKELIEKVESVKNDKNIKLIIQELSVTLLNANIKFKAKYELKHLFSIYRKMVNRNKTLDEMYDIGAYKIEVMSVKDCYIVLGLLHSIYKPVPNRFKDYIACPKENMYQALHTTAINKKGKRIEIQIKTTEMSLVAEYGILSSWKYGEKGIDARSISKTQREKSMWLKQILEWQQEITNNVEFMDLVKKDLNLFSENISCFTPKGDIKRLQKGATVVDFAYAIHSELGNKVVGAYVNGKKQDINYILNNGDLVKIITSNSMSGPKEEWLLFVKTSNARNKIRRWIKGKKIISEEFDDINSGVQKIEVASCCLPVRGENIVGVVCRKNKIIIHRDGCKKANKKICDISADCKKIWGKVEQTEFSSSISVYLDDTLCGKKIKEIFDLFSICHIHLKSFKYNSDKNMFKIIIVVLDMRQLSNLIMQIKSIDNVIKIERNLE